MILDTSFVIDVLRGDPAVADWEAQLDSGRTAIVTAVTVMELSEGIHLADASEPERDRVREFLEDVRHAPFDHTAALQAGELSASLQREGAMVEIEDVMIAAIALGRNETVLTGNPSHFTRIEGLTVERY